MKNPHDRKVVQSSGGKLIVHKLHFKREEINPVSTFMPFKRYKSFECPNFYALKLWSKT